MKKNTNTKATAKADVKKETSKNTAPKAENPAKETAKEEIPAEEDTSKNTPAPAETQTAETPKPEEPATPFEGGIEKELPKEELKVDVVPTGQEGELPNDRVLINDQDLPPVDEVAINKNLMDQETSPYNQDIEVIEETEKEPEPEKNNTEEWVSDPSLIRKSKGVKNTLSGPLYKGIRK